jgi:hypothetical protein
MMSCESFRENRETLDCTLRIALRVERTCSVLRSARIIPSARTLASLPRRQCPDIRARH